MLLHALIKSIYTDWDVYNGKQGSDAAYGFIVSVIIVCYWTSIREENVSLTLGCKEDTVVCTDALIPQSNYFNTLKTQCY